MVKHGNEMEWFIWKEKSIFQIIRRFKNKSYRKIINQQIWNKECLSKSRETISDQKYKMISKIMFRDTRNRTKYNI